MFLQSGNMIQALLMNRSRCRRRLRRGLEDWGNLYQHALNADTSPRFQAYMIVHGWRWENEHPQDPAVSSQLLEPPSALCMSVDGHLAQDWPDDDVAAGTLNCTDEAKMCGTLTPYTAVFRLDMRQYVIGQGFSVLLLP